MSDSGIQYSRSSASSHVKCSHPCVPNKAELELMKIADRWSGHWDYISGRWIGGQGDMRRFDFNVATPYIIPSHMHFFLNILAASVKIYGASASLITHVFKAVFAYTD